MEEPVLRSGIAIENLCPALIQIFAVIGIGYVSGRAKIMTNASASGFNVFIANFVLPSSIFHALSRVNWNLVNWNFALAVLVSKCIVSFLVIVLTLIMTQPKNYGKAGILSIFCIMSADFAIGSPLVDLLYSKSHPEYLGYLFLVTPIIYGLLNPVGYVLMEIQNQRQSQNQMSATRMVVKLLKLLLLSPIIIMTIAGIVASLVLPNGVPNYISCIFEILDRSLAATSLFSLGLRMVGNTKHLKGPSAILPGILITIKLVILPILIRQFVTIFDGKSSDLSEFGFLYGSLPTATGAYVIAAQYNIDVDLIASSLVGCTFLSAPVIFISVKMISVTNITPDNYLSELKAFVSGISIASVCAVIFVLVIFAVAQKVSRIPHRFTCCLLIAQLIGSIGLILWSELDRNSIWHTNLQFSIFSIGQWSSKIFTAILAISLALLNTPKFANLLYLSSYFVAFGFGIPVLLCGSILLFDQSSITSATLQNPNFQYGDLYDIITIIISILSLLIVIYSLMLHYRFEKQFGSFLNLRNVEEPSDSDKVEISATNTQNNRYSRLPSEISQESGEGESVLRNRSTIINQELRSTLVFSYREETDEHLSPLEYDENSDVFQNNRHKGILVLLSISIFVNLALTFWTKSKKYELNGLYVELAFLDAFLNFGQSLIVSAFFISDIKFLFRAILKMWKVFWYGNDSLNLPEFEELDQNVKLLCERFKTYHLRQCVQEIAKDKRWRTQEYQKVFYGYELVDWLVEIGLCSGREEGVTYGRNLLKGRVLRHIREFCDFDDNNLLFKFF